MFVYLSVSVANVLSKNRLLEFFSTSIYQTSIVCIPFSLNQHTSLLAAGAHLLAKKRCVRGFNVLPFREGRSVFTNCNGRWKMDVSLHSWDEAGINDVEMKGRTNISESKARVMSEWSSSGHILECGRRVTGGKHGVGSDCEPRNLLWYTHPTVVGN